MPLMLIAITLNFICTFNSLITANNQFVEIKKIGFFTIYYNKWFAMYCKESAW